MVAQFKIVLLAAIFAAARSQAPVGGPQGRPHVARYLRGEGRGILNRAAPAPTRPTTDRKNGKYKRTDQLPTRHGSKPRLDGRPDLRRQNCRRVRPPLLRNSTCSTNVALGEDTARRDERADVEELLGQGLLAGRCTKMSRERPLALLGFDRRGQVEGRRQDRICREGPDGHGPVQEARVDVLRVLAVDDDDLRIVAASTRPRRRRVVA